jgi:TonB family protein
MKLRKSLVILTLFAFVAVPAAAALRSAKLPHGAQAGTPEWQRYKVDGEKFSVELPVVPAMSTTSTRFARFETRRERIIGAYADGVVYVIRTFEKKGLNLDDLMRKSAAGQTTEVVIDGVKGKSSVREDDKTIWITKWLSTSNNLYQFDAAASKLVDSSAAISKFFTSISFRNNHEGRNIVDGPGEQRFSHANGAQADSIFSTKDVTVRPKVMTKPEPRYTEAARQDQVTGTVVIRAVFSMSGTVEDITVVSGLPGGLTDRAVQAARQLRFIPAIKDGRFVSVRMQLEYNFNLY